MDLCFSVCSALIWGFIAGLIARALMPGEQRMGFWQTSILGIAGSLLGGFAAALLTGRNPLIPHFASLIGSVLGALVLLGLGFGARKRPR